jgi:hypothetical protein
MSDRTPDFQKIGEIEVEGFGRLLIRVGRYPQGGQIAISLLDASTSHPVAVFSTNLVAHGAKVAPDCFAVKIWSENAALVGPMLASGLFKDTGHGIRSGFVEAPVWQLENPDLVPPVDRPKRQGMQEDNPMADTFPVTEAVLSPAEVSYAADLIARAAQDAKARGLPDHAQQLTDRSEQVRSWSIGLSIYDRDGVEVSPKLARQIASATDEFLRYAGYPPMNSGAQKRGRSGGR